MNILSGKSAVVPGSTREAFTGGQSAKPTYAIHEDKVFVGKGGKELEDYLCHVLSLIQQGANARQKIEQMMLLHKPSNTS